MSLLLKLSILIVVISFHVWDGQGGRLPRREDIANALKKGVQKGKEAVDRVEKNVGVRKEVTNKDNGRVDDKDKGKQSAKSESQSEYYSESQNHRGRSRTDESKHSGRQEKKQKTYEYYSSSASKSRSGSRKGSSDKEQHKREEESQRERSKGGERGSESVEIKRTDKKSSGERRSNDNAAMNQWPIAKIDLPVDVKCPYCHQNFKYPLQVVLLPSNMHASHHGHHKLQKSEEQTMIPKVLNKLGQHLVDKYAPGNKASPHHHGSPHGHTPHPVPPANQGPLNKHVDHTKAPPQPSQALQNAKAGAQQILDKVGPAALDGIGALGKKLGIPPGALNKVVPGLKEHEEANGKLLKNGKGKVEEEKKKPEKDAGRKILIKGDSEQGNDKDQAINVEKKVRQSKPGKGEGDNPVTKLNSKPGKPKNKETDLKVKSGKTQGDGESQKTGGMKVTKERKREDRSQKGENEKKDGNKADGENGA